MKAALDRHGDGAPAEAGRRSRAWWAAVVALLAALEGCTLSGCAAAWGEPYHVDFQSPSSITINFDPGLASIGDVQSVAQAHCTQYGKDAVPQLSQDSMWGLRSTSFRCVSRD